MKRKVLKFQVGDFVQKLHDMMPDERRRTPEEYQYLNLFFSAFIRDRNKRASEIGSPRYEKIVERARSIFPMRIFAVMCMDGRVKPIHAYGLPAEIGHSVRTPGGMLEDFKQGKNRVWLKRKSTFADQLDERLDKPYEFSEILDSHMACAARMAAEIPGGVEQDGGLFSDVIDKKKMAEAILAYVAKHHRLKYVPVIQTTFNPSTGYLYMGLETKKAIDAASLHAKSVALQVGRNPKRAKAVYSKEALRKLIKGKKIISTGALINEHAVIKNTFEASSFVPDWKKDYIGTADKFITNILKINDILLPEFEAEVKRVYKSLNSKKDKDVKEIRQRAMLLMTSSYNSYLHNREHIEENFLTLSKEKYKETVNYKYSDHEEQCVKVSERGGHPPYDIPAFLVSSFNRLRLPGHMEKAIKLVRDNRLEKRAKEITGIFNIQTLDGFDAHVKAPVAAPIQVVVDGQKLTEEDWSLLEGFDWTSMLDKWSTLDEEAFGAYIAQTSPRLASALADGIKHLRKTMMAIYDEEASVISDSLIMQDTVAMPIICDHTRFVRAIVPFIKVGHCDAI